MIDVPKQFQCSHITVYPPDNFIEFERWFYLNWEKEDARERIYLPVFWTNYYCRNGYGKWPVPIRQLQDFINSLDKSKKYYTIVQYDLGILNTLKGLDIKVFSMSGPPMDFTIPLICQKHEFDYSNEKSIFASFIGNMTHPLRRVLMQFRKKPGFYMPTKPSGIAEFCEITAKSVFCLAPRGFGPTSFRIQEALQYGAIPVYISDHFVIPTGLNFEDFGVLCLPNDLRRLDRKLRGISEEEIKRKQENGKKVYNEYFSYSGVKKIILKNL